jgi:hypothetical protein
VWQREVNKVLNRKLCEAAPGFSGEAEQEQTPDTSDASAPRTRGMSPEKSLEYIKRWKGLECRRQQLDYDVSRWCNDVRSEFQMGAEGDAKFRNWIDVELALSETRKAEIVLRVAAFSALPDRAQYESLGGFSHVKKLIPLNKRDRVSVIGEARASGKLIGGVIRARDEAKARRAARAAPAREPRTQITIYLTSRELAAWREAAGTRPVHEWLKSLGQAAARK